MGPDLYPGYVRDPNVREDQGNYLRSGQYVVAATPVMLAAKNPFRFGLVVTNTGNATVYVSSDSGVTAANGHALLSLQSLNIANTSALYGISSPGPNTVTTLEEIR